MKTISGLKFYLDRFIIPGCVVVLGKTSSQWGIVTGKPPPRLHLCADHNIVAIAITVQVSASPTKASMAGTVSSLVGSTA